MGPAGVPAALKLETSLRACLPTGRPGAKRVAKQSKMQSRRDLSPFGPFCCQMSRTDT